MFCLVADLTDTGEYPAAQLARLYKWRWDRSETALREAKASLGGGGPGTGPMLRSQSPAMVRQELAAWAAATEMTRRAVTAAIRAGWACCEVLTREIAKCRTVVDQNRHRARKSKSPSSFGHATAKDTRTRIAPAVIIMANAPA